MQNYIPFKSCQQESRREDCPTPPVKFFKEITIKVLEIKLEGFWSHFIHGNTTVDFRTVPYCTELRFVHFLSDFFKAGILGQDIQNPNKVWKVTCKIARVFAEICRFHQNMSWKWPHFARKVAPFFPTYKNDFFSRQKWDFEILL